MRNPKLYIPLLILITFTLLSATLRTNGSPGGYTNSPLDGSSCTECHGGSTSSVNWINTNIPTEGYVPGTTYTITAATLNQNSSKMGFEVTAENNASKQGTFIITDNGRTQLTNSNKAVTHSKNGTTVNGGNASWTLDWKAPVAGTGEVNVYGAFNVSNSNGSSGGDKIFVSTLLIKEDVSTRIKNITTVHASIYPNPSRGNFTVTTTQPIVQVSIYNMKGQLLQLHKASNKLSVSMECTYGNSGMYILKTETTEGVNTRKIQIR